MLLLVFCYMQNLKILHVRIQMSIIVIDFMEMVTNWSLLADTNLEAGKGRSLIDQSLNN